MYLAMLFFAITLHYMDPKRGLPQIDSERAVGVRKYLSVASKGGSLSGLLCCYCYLTKGDKLVCIRSSYMLALAKLVSLGISYWKTD